MPYRTIEQMESLVGEKIRAYRLDRNQTQSQLAAISGVSEGTLRNLESGAGATLSTFLRVLKALDLEGWLDTLAPISAVNPLLLVKEQPRQRARKKKNGH